MAQKLKLDYGKQVSKLKADGPGRLYVLYGQEDYLTESFASEIRALCIASETQEFNYRKLSIQVSEISKLAEAVDSMPFMSEHTLIEVREFDINKCKGESAELFKKIVSDIPEYCTLVFMYTNSYEPDKRLVCMKAVSKYGEILNFQAQNQSMLTKWISRRFASAEKTIQRQDAEHLIYITGGLMSRLVPEIEKLSVYAGGETVTRREIDAVVQRLPEADVFEMADRLSLLDYDGAMSILSELLLQREHPIKLLSIIGQQFRRLYAARLALDCRLGRSEFMELCGVRFDFILNKLKAAAEKFTLEGLSDILQFCADADLKMKSTGEDDEDILNLLLMKISMRVNA